MFTTATSKIRSNFRSNRLLQTLLGWYAFFWILTAIAPVDRRDWLMENFLVAVVIGILFTTYRIFPLSDLSYLLFTAFLTLHAIGAHYTYAQVPFGLWMQSALHLSRNHFDRLVHFSFGLMIAYPFREIFLRVAKAREFWAYYLPLDVTLAFSALFEIFESWVAQIANPALGQAYLGSQGDTWDAQNDMAAALAGAILCMILTAVLRRKFRKRARWVAQPEYIVMKERIPVDAK